MLGRVHFCGCWAGSTAQMFVRVHLWTISGKTNIQGVIFRHRIHGPVQTFRRPNIRFFGRENVCTGTTTQEEGTMLVRVHFRKGESAGGRGANIHDFSCTRNHFRKLVRVGLTQMFVRVSRFKTFRKMPVQHPGCENAFSGAFQRGASCVFPPPDVGTCPLWGKKKPLGSNIAF